MAPNLNRPAGTRHSGDHLVGGHKLLCLVEDLENISVDDQELGFTQQYLFLRHPFGFVDLIGGAAKAAIVAEGRQHRAVAANPAVTDARARELATEIC